MRSQPLVIGAERLRHRGATDRAVPRQEAGRTVGAPDLVRVSNHRVRVKVRVRARARARVRVSHAAWARHDVPKQA